MYILPKINIVVLNWNGYKDTAELIESIYKISFTNHKVIVVDNHSANNDIEKLNSNFGELIQIISCNDNLGFSGGNNVGINHALDCKADFILLLNNDTIVEEDFLEILIKEIKKDKDIGIVAPQINYYDEPEKIWSAGGKISKLKGSGFADSDKLEKEVKKIIKPVSFVSGCCMLIRREVFEKIGLLDENYFLYIEDTDFCFRTINAGFKIHVVPESKIYHKVSSTTAKDNSLLPLYYATRNRLYFAKKNFPQIYFLTAGYLFLSMLLKSLKWLLQGKINNIKIVYLAFKDYFLGKMGKADINFG